MPLCDVESTRLRQDVPVEPEEQEPSRLIGWHVVEAGRREAWPFVNLADPQSGREVRLYLDTTFSVLPGYTGVRQHEATALPALDALSGASVTSVRAEDGGLDLVLGNLTLSVLGKPNELTSHAPWWVGRASQS